MWWDNDNLSFIKKNHIEQSITDKKYSSYSKHWYEFVPNGNIGDASNNNQKQLHHSIALSDPKTVIAYYNLVLLQMYELLWFGIARIGYTKRLLSQWLFTSLTY